MRRLLGCGCMGVLVSIAMIWGGGQGIYTWMNNREPLEMSCQEYLRTRPDAAWLRLTDCELSLPGAAFTAGWDDAPDELFIPVRPAGWHEADSAEAVPLVLVTEDPELLEQMKGILEVDETGNQSEIVSYLVQHAEQVYPVRDVEGLVQFGIELDSEDRREVLELIEDLAGDFVMVEDGGRPQLLFSAFMAGGGVLILLGLAIAGVVSVRSESPSQPKNPPPAPDEAPPAAPPPITPR